MRRLTLCGLLGCLCSLFLCPPCARAQVSGGPRGEGLKKARTGAYTISASSASFSNILSLHIPLRGRQALGISTELVRLSSFYVKMTNFEGEADWKFQGVPVTLSYEYTLPTVGRFSPVVGAGASVYLSKLKQAMASSVPTERRFDRQLGVGYGLQATFGLKTMLNRRLFLLAQGRYRYVNSTAFLGGGRYNAAFPVLDVALGFGFSF